MLLFLDNDALPPIADGDMSSSQIVIVDADAVVSKLQLLSVIIFFICFTAVIYPLNFHAVIFYHCSFSLCDAVLAWYVLLTCVSSCHRQVL